MGIQPLSPGSLMDFAESNGYTTNDSVIFRREVIDAHSRELAAYRQELAISQGLTAEELHQLGAKALIDIERVALTD